MNYLNRTICYKRTEEEKAYFKVLSVYVSARDQAAPTTIRTRDSYGYTKPDQVVRYKVQNDPDKCTCEGWGCQLCCSSDAEIRSRQGIFG